MASSRMRSFTAILFGQQAVQAPHSMQSSGPVKSENGFISPVIIAGMSMPAGHAALHLPQFVQALFAP